MNPLLLWIGLAQADDGGLEERLEAAFVEVSENATWRSPYAAERTALREATSLLVRDAQECGEATLEAARRLLGPADFRLDEIGVGAERVLVVREGVERRGAGLYAIRCGPARPIAWQAPHAFHDLKTDTIARDLFVETGARVVMWNTVHRYEALPGESRSDPVHPADVTREHGSLFQAATVGLAAGDPTLRFAQMHGFARSSSAYEVIVSTGDSEAPPTAIATALDPVIGDAAAYGEDVEDLGGTTNVQGQMLRELPGRRFLHVELSPEARDKLATDAAMRAAFARIIADGAW